MDALVVGTSDGAHVLGSDRVDHAGRIVDALAGTRDELWAIVDGKEVWRNDERVYVSPDLRLNCIMPAGEEVYVGTSEAQLGRLTDGGLRLLEGFTAAPDRDSWYTPWGGPPDVRSMAMLDDRILVNVHVGGIVASEDAGATWRQTIDIHTDVHQVIAADGVVLAAGATGLALSRNGTEDWELDSEGLHASYCRAVAVAEDQVLISACVGPHGGRSAIYRRNITSGATFQRCETGLPGWFGDNIDTGCLAASGPFVAFGTSEGDVFLSEDSGATWTHAASGIGTARWLLFL